MKLSATIVIIYALIVLIGGLIGHLKADSLPSLILGGIFGLLLLTSGISMLKNRVTGCLAALSLASILALFFTYRFFLTGAFMPAGMMALMSIGVAGYLFFVKKI